MPNNNIFSQEQKRKAICFRIAAVKGNLQEIHKYCDAYTLNDVDSKGNTPLHLASEKGHDEILKFLFQQPKINFHRRNSENKKAVDSVNQMSTVKLWQALLTRERNLVQASVLRQKNLLKKNYDLVLNNHNTQDFFTIEDLSQINAYVKQTLVYGAPDWKQEKFPHQQATRASQWKKKEADYYRIDMLQDLLSIIEKELAEIIFNNTTRALIIRVIHCSLAEVIKVGRCYEQVAVAFYQLLFSEKKGRIQWLQAENSKWIPTENENMTRGHSFIIFDKQGGEKPETWESGLLMDPMDDRTEYLKESASKLMDNLVRIMAQPDKNQIKISENMIFTLPLKQEHHASLAENLEFVGKLLKSFFAFNWHIFWPEMKRNYPHLKEKMVKNWLEKLWHLLEKKTDIHSFIHSFIADKLHLDEIQDSMARLECRFEALNLSTQTLSFN